MNVANTGASWWSVLGLIAWVLSLAVVADLAATSWARMVAAAAWVALSVVGCAVAGRGDA